MEKITQCETTKLVLFKSRRTKWTDQTARVRDKEEILTRFWPRDETNE